MTDPITPDTVRKALEEGAPTCIKCGHKRGEHPYRHVFQPSHEVKITLADLARAYLDAIEENARMRDAVLEEAATFVETHEVGRHPRHGYVVAPSTIEGAMATHAGMAYAKAIRAMCSTKEQSDD